MPILRQEILELAALGVDAIQLDEPLLPRLSDPETYNLRPDPAALSAAVELSVQTINEVAGGLDSVYLSVHLCHAHGAAYHAHAGAIGLIQSAIARYRVDRIAMEINSPVARALQSLEEFPADKILGLGVIAPKDPELETPALVVERAERALCTINPDRIVLNPDCGCATTASSSGDLKLAGRKLTAMCAGARILRERHALSSG